MAAVQRVQTCAAARELERSETVTGKDALSHTTHEFLSSHSEAASLEHFCAIVFKIAIKSCLTTTTDVLSEETEAEIRFGVSLRAATATQVIRPLGPG